jgi:uncharacterized membrane protein YgdD (TMEM256/DUF423 family)
MANIGVSSIKLIDSDGDALDDGAGKLNVNATLVAGASIDIGDVQVKGYSSVFNSLKNLSGSADQLLSIACKHVDIMATLANTGIVYIGASGVSATTGIALYPGDVYSVDIENTNLLYAMSTVVGDDINIVGFL